MDDIAKVLGIVLFLAIVCFAIYGISNWAINLAEVNVIKKVNPSYKTKIELEKEEKAKKAELVKKEEEIRQREIELEYAEDLKERQMEAHIHRRDIENVLKKKGYNFVVPPGCGFYVLDNTIWVCGILFTEDLEGKHNYPAIVISEDGGSSYKLLRTFNEFKTPYASCMFFPEKECGYLSVSAYNSSIYYCILYKTTNRGHNWDIVLSTKNAYRLRNFGLVFIKMRVTNQKFSLVGSSQGEGSFESIESNDGEKSWTYKINNKEVAKTSDRGETWQIMGEKKQ